MPQITVDPSQVHSISVDPSQVSASSSGNISLGNTEMKPDSTGSRLLRQVLSYLPAIGMTAGSVVGTAGGAPGEVAGGALGGGAGEALRQLAAHGLYGGGPQSSGEAASEIGTQGAVGAAGAGLGLAANAAAPSVVEGALGINRAGRTFGKTPGRAVLEETSGIRPGTVMESAKDAWKNLNSQLEAQAASSPATATIQPALNIIDQAKATATQRGNKTLFDKLVELQNFLTTNQVTGQARPIVRSAADILDTKRGLKEEMRSWTPEAKSALDAISRKVYGSLDKQLDSAVPAAADLNQRISSLIPAEQRARAVDEGAELTQRVMHRVGAHTGALIGAAAGYKEGGVPGGLAGLIAPELLVSPTFQIALARALATKGLLPAAVGALAQIPRTSDMEPNAPTVVGGR